MSLPSPARRRIVTVLAVFPWAVLLGQLAFVLPRYNKVFNEFGLKLPDAIDAVFAVSTWVHTHLFLASLISFVLAGASVFVAHFVQVTPGSSARRLLVLFLVFAIPCLLFLASWVGVFWAQRKLAEGFNR